VRSCPGDCAKPRRRGLGSQGRSLVDARPGFRVHCHQQFGPDLSIASHDTWRQRWDTFAASPRHEAPDSLIGTNIGVGSKPWATRPGENTPDHTGEVRGGRKAAIKLLREILKHTSNLAEIGRETPQKAASQFRQLEPYLELGSISVREVWQAAMSAHHQYAAAGHDIRAVRVMALVKHLPSLFLRRFENSHAPIDRPSLSKTSRSVDLDKQLSLDLF